MSVQPRHKAGANGGVGGRWAETRREEAGGVSVRFAADEELLRGAKRMAQHAVFGGVDPDDLASEALLAVLTQRSRDSGANVSDEAVAVRKTTNEMKLVKAVVSRAMARAVASGHIGDGVYFGARRELREVKAAFEARNGRTPTVTEVEKMADRIRLSRPPGRRPRGDFWIDYRQVELSDPHVRLAATPAADEPRFDGFEPGSAGDRAYETLEAGRSSGRARAIRLAWAAIAERTGAPMAIQGSLAASSAAAARKAVSASGGALSAARRHLDGSLDADTAKHLFAPFGVLSPSERDAVAEQLTSFPHHASDLYSAALRTATVQRIR